MHEVHTIKKCLTGDCFRIMSVIEHWKFDVTLQESFKSDSQVELRQRLPYHMFGLTNLDTTLILTYFSREFVT